MSNIWLTSDTHFCHDREFVYKPRGFSTVYEMNDEIVRRWNEAVAPDDDVYHLGDVMLNDDDQGLKLLKSLKGNIHIVLGNHDTEKRIKLYETCWNVVEIELAIRLKYKGYHFFLTHFPCMTGNIEKESLKQCTCNFFGHTHQDTNFYNDYPFMYHVGLDSHSCYPISIDDAIEEMKKEYRRNESSLKRHEDHP